MGRPDQSEVAARADVAKGGAFVAHMYDLVLALGEKRSMGELRRKTIADAGGSVLEIGAGTGLNTEYYPKDLERLVICEPEENMVEQLRKRVESLGVEAEVVRAAAEALPFDDDSFDTVTAMLVLCTVDDPAASIAEPSVAIICSMPSSAMPCSRAPASPARPRRSPCMAQPCSTSRSALASSPCAAGGACGRRKWR